MKKPLYTKAEDARRAELKELRERLGLVGMIRHIQKERPGTGDFTDERRAWAEHVSQEEIVGDLNELRRARGEEELVWPARGDAPV